MWIVIPGKSNGGDKMYCIFCKQFSPMGDEKGRGGVLYRDGNQRSVNSRNRLDSVGRYCKKCVSRGREV